MANEKHKADFFKAALWEKLLKDQDIYEIADDHREKSSKILMDKRAKHSADTAQRSD